MNNLERCETIETQVIDSWIKEFFFSTGKMKKQISKEDITIFLEMLRKNIKDIVPLELNCESIIYELEEIFNDLSSLETNIGPKLKTNSEDR